MKTSVKIILGATGLLVFGTASYLYSQVLKLKNGAFKVFGAKDLKINAGNLSVTLLARFKNNSDISATVKDQYYEIFVNDKKVGEVSNAESIKVSSNGESVIPLNIKANLLSVLTEGLANLGNYFNNQDAVTLKIKGYLTWKSGLISSRQPFEVSQTLKEINQLILESKTT
jgi:LEA14-like dessication related protein